MNYSQQRCKMDDVLVTCDQFILVDYCDASTEMCPRYKRSEEKIKSKRRTIAAFHLTSEPHVILIPTITPAARNNFFLLATRGRMLVSGW